MRTLGTALLVTSLLVTTAIAAPLAPGKPAGVKKAQLGDNSTIFVIAGVGLVGLGIGLAVSGDNNTVTPATTTSTSTGTSS